MCNRHPGARPEGARRPSRAWAWALLLLFQFACATSLPGAGLARPPVQEREVSTQKPGLESAIVYGLDFMEPGAVVVRPLPISTAEFQQSLWRLAHDVRRAAKTPRQAAHELLDLQQSPSDELTVAAAGFWKLEFHAGQGYTWIPERQEDSVVLTPQAEQALKKRYLQWCEHRGGGDCLGLLDDDPYLRTDDRRALSLALAFGGVLEETRAALGRELLDVRALTSTVVWTVALYCMMWVVPEPTMKAVAASITLLLMGYLGLQTVYGLMDSWARLADTAHHATTFEELRAAGAEFGKVLGEDAARAMILAVATLSGHTLGQPTSRMKSLPSFDLAGARFEAQGGAALLLNATEGALARAVVTAEVVATSPQGPLAVVMFKQGQSHGRETTPGGRASATVLRHRGGNRQVELSDGQRWHLPRGKSATDIPAEDKVGDMLQEAVIRAAREWGPQKLSNNELAAIEKATKNGEYWLARLLEREARGRYVQTTVKDQFEHLYDFSLSRGVDVADLTTGIRYEILSGTTSNLARHARRMAGEFFRMLTF